MKSIKLFLNRIKFLLQKQAGITQGQKPYPNWYNFFALCSTENGTRLHFTPDSPTVCNTEANKFIPYIALPKLKENIL